MKEKIEILNDEIEYITIENEETSEIIATITQYDVKCIKPYIIKVKLIPLEKD